VAYLTGLGRSSTQIAAELNDGTMGATIRRQWALWGIPMRSAESRFITVPVLRQDQQNIARRAQSIGLTPEEWCSRILGVAARDDLYTAIVGDDE